MGRMRLMGLCLRDTCTHRMAWVHRNQHKYEQTCKSSVSSCIDPFGRGNRFVSCEIAHEIGSGTQWEAPRGTESSSSGCCSKQAERTNWIFPFLSPSSWCCVPCLLWNPEREPKGREAAVERTAWTANLVVVNVTAPSRDLQYVS